MSKPLRTLLLLPCLSLAAHASQVVVTEVMYNPPAGKPEWIELKNLTSGRIDTAKWVLSGGVNYTFPDFNAATPAAHFLNEYERIILSSASEAVTRAAYPDIPIFAKVLGPWTGALNNAGDSIVVRDAANAEQTRLSYGDGGSWPVAPDGTGHSLAVINQDRAINDWRNWRHGARNGGTPGYEEITVAETPLPVSPDLTLVDYSTVVNYTSPWKYWRDAADPDGVNPEGTWKGISFNDTAWPGPGNGFFGHEPSNATLSSAIQTSFTTGYTSSTLTYYFRTTFNWTGSTANTAFTLDQFVDDGVVYWLNGQELKGPNLGRVRVNAGTTTHTTQATGTPPSGDAGDELLAITGSLDGQLVNGTNVLCAEVHQSGTGSSDIYFGARLKIGQSAPAGVIINEVKPSTVTGQGFVEFYNPTASSIDLNGFYLTDTQSNLTKFQITGALVVPPSGFATVGFAESSLTIANPLLVMLVRPDGIQRQTAVSISSPVTDGRSTGRKPAGGASWFLFTDPTPGAANQSTLLPPPTLKLSEAHFAPTGRVDWVEVANPSASAQAGTGLFVASAEDFSDKAPLPASVGGSSYVSIPVDWPGGTVRLYLIDSSNNVLDALRITHLTGYDSIQRFPLSSQEWYNSTSATQDAVNNPPLSTDIVINEVMYDLPSKHTDGEFIELTNRGAAPVDLTGWRFTRGINFDFPAGTMIAPGEFIVIAHNPAFITATYGGGVRVFGPVGTLKNSGELIRLEDARGNLADSVDYKDSGNWPEAAGGAGSSMELLHPDMDNSQPSSWRASNESAKAAFQTYSHTGTYRQLRGAPTAETGYEELLLNMVSDGHVILRNMHLSKSTAPATNILPAGTPTSHNGTGTGGFHAKGTHRLSDTLPGGEFNLISAGGGDTKGNLAEIDITSIAANDILTLTFEARWVSGLPLMVAQTWDRSFGKVFRFPIPNNLGTPGAANSRLLPGPAPTVDNIWHSPAVPTSTQAVTVTARVSSAAPLASVELRERIDSVAGNGAWNTIVMSDSGTGADATAGDGIYSASVAARANGTITQFYVRATTTAGRQNECPRNGQGVPRTNGSVIEVPMRPAMWIVANTPPPAEPGILHERHIFSQYDRNAMNTGTGFSATYDWDFPRPSNFGLNSTVIINEKDILYNCEIRKGGSPWTRNGNNSMERMRWKPPGDDLFRGRTRFAIDSDGTITNTAARFHNRLARYMLYLFGYPVPYAEFVQQTINGDGTTWRDNMELTDEDFFDRAYGDGGELYEIDDAWFMYDTNNGDDRISADGLTGRWFLSDWTNPVLWATPSEEDPIYFHGNWPLRFPEDRYDYSALSAFIKTAYNGLTNITGTAADDLLTTTGHGLVTGESVRIIGITGGEVAAGTSSINVNNTYYAIVISPDTFKLAASPANATSGIAVNFGTNITAGNFIVLPADGLPRGNAFREQMERMIDVDRSAIYAAVRGYIGDWDNFTLNRGKNGYFYRRPGDGKFEFHHWDSDLAFQNTGEGWIGTAGGIGWENLSTRPWWRARFNYYLTQLVTRYTGGSARMNAWLDAMNYQAANTHANAPYKTSSFNYPTTWFAARDTNALNFIGAGNHTRAFNVSTANNQTVATPVFTINGAASSRVSFVELAGHPEAVFAWEPTAANLGLWKLTNVALSNGLNALTIRGIGGDGAVLHTAVLNVTLSANAPPVVVLTADPASRRVEAGELISFDATASFDPEATALSYAWTVTPAPGSAVSHSVPGKAEIRFYVPGIYTVSVTVTDGASQSSTGTSEVTVFNAEDFQAFAAAEPLGPAWTVQNLELRDNFSPSSWYSVEDITGRLHVQILSDSAKPLASPAFTHPLITRDLPDSSDFILQTDLEPDTREFGNWQTGLWVEVDEAGTVVRYALSLDGGTSVTVRRAAQPGAWTQSATQSVTGSGVTLRVRRTGALLAFQRHDGAQWITVHSQTLPGGSAALTGGVFAATSQATDVRVSFDYVLVSDPASFDPVLAGLRITEVHYNPAPGGVEFVELRNTGSQTIDLTGVSFGEGQPFSTAGIPLTAYTFGSLSLAPGEFIVVPENTAAFQSVYGTAARLAPAWTSGNLSNGGERITLYDASGNTIHDFNYDDTAPWPLAADGTGPSMEVISVSGDYNDGANWRAGSEAAGSPGYAGIGPDTDGDGYPDSVEALFGTAAGDRNSAPLATSSTNANGHILLSWPFTAGVLYDVEFSTDLVNWSVLQTVNGAGTWTDLDAALSTSPRRCYRITARLP